MMTRVAPTRQTEVVGNGGNVFKSFTVSACLVVSRFARYGRKRREAARNFTIERYCATGTRLGHVACGLQNSWFASN